MLKKTIQRITYLLRKKYTIYQYTKNGVNRDKIVYVDSPTALYIDDYLNFRATMTMTLKPYTLTTKCNLDNHDINTINLKEKHLITYIKGKNKYRYCAVD